MKELDACLAAAKPRAEIHPALWCAENVHIENPMVSAKFAPDQLRWWIKPMGCMADYETRHMVCIMPTGFGKSTFFEAITCWITSEAPGSVLYASMSDKNAELWGETRLRKALRKCDPLKPLWPANERNDFRKDTLVWPHMFMSIGGANMSNFQEISITYGLGDEAWAWKHGLVREWLARSHNRENRKFVLASQAGFIASEDGLGVTSELHSEYDKCRQWDFGWRCECGSEQPFYFEQMEWDTIEGDDQASAETCRRICPSCKKAHADTVTIRRQLHDSIEENDGYVITRETGLTGYEGFHVDAGANWRIPWKEDVLQKLEADRQMALGDHTKRMQWEQKRRARGWDMTKAVTTTDIKTSDYSSTDFINGSMIDGEQIRFATVDVGADHYWLRIRSWAAGGDSKGLKASYIGTDDELIRTIEEYGIQPQCVFVDVGFDQERIASLCVKHGWRGVKGDGNRKAGWEWPITSGPRKGQRETRLYGPKFLAKSKEGFRCEVWPVATTPLQYILQRLIEGKGAKWEVESDAPPTFAKHLNSERLVAKRNPQGHDVPTWTRFGANHFRDTEVYQLAAALMAGAFRPSKEDVEAATPAED